MVRQMMPKLFDPWMWVWPETPDGFAEVTIEISGRILASTVGYFGCDWNAVHERLMAELARKC